eukprot:3785955-Rhodomonas_salina.2
MIRHVQSGGCRNFSQLQTIPGEARKGDPEEREVVTVLWEGAKNLGWLPKPSPPATHLFLTLFPHPLQVEIQLPISHLLPTSPLPRASGQSSPAVAFEVLFSAPSFPAPSP